MQNPLVTALYVYPVKSMKGIALSSAVLTSKGLQHDRSWMVVAPDGRFVTQRNEPRLGLVHTRLEAQGVVLELDGHGSVTLPYEAVAGDGISTQVWGDACETVDQGPAVSEWLTRAIGSPVTLRVVRMAPGFTRPQTQPERYGQETATDFADSAPFLLASEDSLGELNSALAAQGRRPVPMNRFRPNIVVRGLEPFAEHRLSGVTGEQLAGKVGAAHGVAAGQLPRTLPDIAPDQPRTRPETDPGFWAERAAGQGRRPGDRRGRPAVDQLLKPGTGPNMVLCRTVINPTSR